MDLLEKLKMVRDEINLLIESEEKKKAFQSEVGKKFSERIKGMERKDGSDRMHQRMIEVLFKKEDEIITKEIEKIF